MHGVPQRLLSDNGLALNPSRRGFLGLLVQHGSALDTEAFTGEPCKPTTLGKDERPHQTVSRYPDQQPLADTLAQLQTQVDAFDHVCTTGRPHQGRPRRVTPQVAWEATARAQAVARRHHPAPTPAPAPKDLPDGTIVKTLTSPRTFQQVLVMVEDDTITVADPDGEILIAHTRPTPGIRYVGSSRPRRPPPTTP